MKKIVALFLTALLVCGSIKPVILRAEDALQSRGGQNPSRPTTKPQTPPVPTTSPAAIVLEHFDQADPPGAMAFALGTSQEDLLKQLDSISKYFYAYDAQGEMYPILAGAWTLDNMDLNTSGLYHIKRQPVFDENFDQEYSLADGISLPQQLVAISIQIPGQLEIDYVSPGRGSLRFPWVLSPEQVSQLRQLEELGQDSDFAKVWLQKNKAQWTQLKNHYKFAPDAFYLSVDLLEEGSTYDLQIDYAGGQTGVLTFQYQSPLNVINYSQGNRDGGDVSGTPSSGGFQPAPILPKKPDLPPAQPTHTPSPDLIPASPMISLSDIENFYHQIEAIISFVLKEYVPSSLPVPPSHEDEVEVENENENEDEDEDEDEDENLAPAIITANKESKSKIQKPQALPKTSPPATRKDTLPVQEFYSPEHTIISGLRLHDLCMEEERVVFGSGDLTVSIPSHLLLSLKLSHTDTLSLKLSQPSKDQISLELSAFEKPISQLPGAMIRLAYRPLSKEAKIRVYSPSDTLILDATFDGQFLRFKSERAGIYIIQEEAVDLANPETITPHKASLPLLPLLATVIFSMGAITLFWRRRNG